MPVAVGAAIAGAVVSQTVVSSLVLGAVVGSVGATIIGATVGIGVSSLITAAFSDKPDAPAQFEQELRDFLLTVRQPITHWQYIYGRARAGGALTFAHESANGNLHLVITLAGHVCEQIEAVHFNDEVVPLDGSGNATGRYAGFVRILKSLGAEAGQPFAALVAESDGKWTDAHRQSGRTKIYVRLTANADLFPTGIPNITAVLKGKKHYDPRSATTAYTDNASLCIAGLIADPVWLGAVYASEIDETQLIAAANIDDENVALAGGGNEKRYTLNGAFTVNNDSRGVLARLLSANAGRVHYVGGVFRILPAVYNAPTLSFGLDDLRGVPAIEPRLSATDAFNAVKGVYVSEANLWQQSDFPPITNATYLAEDGGERSWRELDLPFTKSAATAQRIAKIELERARQQISVTWPGKLTCYRAMPGRVVQITFAMLGWSAKAFEVLGGGLTLEQDDGGAPVLGSTLLLRETASAVFDWSSGEETTVDPAPDTNLPSPLTVAAPGTLAVAEELYETRDGRGVAAKAIVSWSAQDQFAASHQLEYKPIAESVYTVLPLTRATTVEILDIAPGRYDFRVKTLNQLGVSSAYATLANKEIAGLTAAPSAPTGFSIQAGGGTARLKFDPSSELDVLRGGRVLVRFCHETVVSPSWQKSFSVGESQGWAGDATTIDVPLKPGTYFIKFQDSTGYESATAASFETKQASILAFSSLAALTFEPDFEGTHSGTANVDGQLTLGGVGLWDDIPDFDAVDNIDGYGGIATTGIWTAATGTDLGSVKNVRITSRLEGAVDLLLDTIDERAENVDDWLDWDGATLDGSAADAWLEARETDDDPAGSPTWSEFKRVDAAEFSARGFQYRAVVKSFDTSYRPLVDTLRVSIQEVV